jgi:dipeptidyl aminopeptidase/acylaminoacyl peptidase
MSAAGQPPAPLMGEVTGPPSMSVDGRYVAWLSSGDAAPRLVLLDVDSRTERGRVDPRAARTRAFAWSHLPGVAVAVADSTGSENWTLYRVGADTGDWAPLGGPSQAQMRVAALSPQRPGEVLVATNGRDPRHHDYDLVSLHTGERTRLLENTGYSAVYFDEALRPRLVETVNADGSRSLWHGVPSRGRLFLRVPHEEALCVRFTHFSADGAVAYFVRPDGPVTMRLAGLRCVDGQPATEVETAFTVPRADVVRVLAAPSTGRPQFVEVDRFRPRTVALDPSWEPALRALRHRLGGEPALLERRLDDRYWLLATHRPDVDTRYFVYQPGPDDLWPLPAARTGPARPPVTCRVADVPMRDGQRAVTYVTGPGVTGPGASPPDASRPGASRPGRSAAAPPPAVLLVHGGPWRRSRWEYDERRTWLARQGLTVIEPNFRGSTGFGSAWVNAADRQWGAAMQDDLEDTLDRMVRWGYADPSRIALVGGSYGGYAVLQLAATSTREFRCVIATSPVTDLVAFVQALPAYWQTAAPMVRRRVGDPADAGQRRVMTRRSPLYNAASIRCPVLLVHGLNDSRVPPEMATRMFMALARGDRDATLALFPDEGHEIVSTGNRLACDALKAAFLARHVWDEDRPEPAPFATTMKLLHTPRRSGAGTPRQMYGALS